MSSKLKVIVLGLGNFGRGWARNIVPACQEDAVLAAVVDQRQERWDVVDPSVPRYASLEQAVHEVRPDLVINVTPPDAHTALNKLLLGKGIPVLCEKPIADSLDSAMEMGAFLKENGGFLMIGENYRYNAVIRKAKELLQSGGLGALRQFSCHFRHYHQDYSMFYHGALPHPLLEDVTIHHLDLARYLSGEEPVNVMCREYSAPYCWYGNRPATVHMLSDMTNGCVFQYDGTLASPQSTTTWNGDWELQCDNGVIAIRSDKLYLYQNDEVREIPLSVHEKDSRISMLKEACRAISEGRRGETDFSDNLHSFAWMQYAMRSAESGRMIDIAAKEG